MRFPQARSLLSVLLPIRLTPEMKGLHGAIERYATLHDHCRNLALGLEPRDARGSVKFFSMVEEFDGETVEQRPK